MIIYIIAYSSKLSQIIPGVKRHPDTHGNLQRDDSIPRVGLKLFTGSDLCNSVFSPTSHQQENAHGTSYVMHVCVCVCVCICVCYDPMFENYFQQDRKHFISLNKLGRHEARVFIGLILAEISSALTCAAHCDLILKSTIIFKTRIQGPTWRGQPETLCCNPMLSSV